MLRLNLKRSIATVAVIAGVLAVPGSASASVTPLQNSMSLSDSTSAGFKSLSGMDSETEFMDYTDDSLLD